jgi:ribonuclease P protein component
MAGLPGDRHFFLRHSAEIQRVKQDGHRVQTALFNLVSCPAKPLQAGQHAPMPPTRIGIVVGQRLGRAVTRNRAKRIFRELARQVRTRLTQGHELLVFPRREALFTRHTLLRDAWVAALQREGLLIPQTDSECGDSVSR